MLLPTSVDRRVLWKYVNRKFKGTIHHYHVLAVITILFDEMVKDLKQGKQIEIANFGTLSLKQMKPRFHHDVRLKRMVHVPGRRTLRFALASKIRNKLCLSLDIDRTFEGD
jgi:nucleoid DNA-binding protein